MLHRQEGENRAGAKTDQFSAMLPTLPGGCLDRRIALINIRNIQRELTRRDMTSGRWL